MSAARSAPPLLVATLGVGVLCVMDAVMKHIVSLAEPMTATFLRSVMTGVIAVPIWLAAGRPALTRDVWRAHGLRGTMGAISAASFFWALTVLPLAEAVTLSFIAPLIIPFMAWGLLGERPRATSLVAALIGFTGVLVTTQGAPPSEDTPQRTLGIAVMLLAGATWAMSLVLLRGRAAKDGPAIVILLGALIPAAWLAPVAAVVGAPPPDAAWLWLAVSAALAVAGVWLLSYAYARAQAQALAPLEFTALIWAAALGYVFFDEVPRLQVFAGAAIIIASCLYIAWDERRIAGAAAS